MLNFREFHSQKLFIMRKSVFQLVIQSSQRLLNQKQLVKLIFPWKQRIPINKFAHNAAYCPQINLLSILPSNKQLGRPVPPRCHVICQILVLLSADLPSEPEVTYFEALLAADQQILGLDVPVYNILLVEVGQSFQKLKNNRTNKWKGQPFGRFLKHLQKIIFQVLENEVDNAFFPESLLQLHDVRVDGHFQQLHLPNGSFFSMCLLVCFFEFFYGDIGI